MARGHTSQPETEQEPIGEANATEPRPVLLSWTSQEPSALGRSPLYEGSRLDALWNNVFHRCLDRLRDRGQRVPVRGTPRVRLAHLHAHLYVVWPSELKAELREGRTYLHQETQRMVDQEYDLGAYGEVALSDASGKRIGTFLQEDLGFLGNPYARRNLDQLAKVLRQEYPGCDAALVHAWGHRPGQSRGKLKEAVSLYVPSLDRYELHDGDVTMVRKPAFAYYDGRDPLGFVTRILKQNLADEVRIPFREIEGLVAKDRWQAAQRAYEFATARSVPLWHIKYCLNTDGSRTGFQNPLDAFQGVPNGDVVAHNYHALWDEENDRQRDDCTLQDLRRETEFEAKNAAVNQWGQVLEFARP